MKFLILLPILVYSILLLGNVNLLRMTQEINILWITTMTLPFFLINSVFIIWYTIFVFFIYDWINMFLNFKIKKLDKEIVELKSKLYDWQKDLIETLTKNYHNSLDEFKKDNLLKFQTIIKYNEYTLDKIISENQSDFEKHKKESSKLLAKSKFSESEDEGFFDKLKSWSK